MAPDALPCEDALRKFSDGWSEYMLYCWNSGSDFVDCRTAFKRACEPNTGDTMLALSDSVESMCCENRVMP